MLIADLLEPDLRLIFCGTAPSRASFAARAYYAKPGNRFWPTLAAVGLTPRRFAPSQYGQLLDLGIGLTDLCKLHCGNDHELPKGSLDALALLEKLRLFRPRRVAFTSKNAGQAALGRKVSCYGRQPESLEGAEVWVLPSPSGLATKFWDQTPWQQLALSLEEGGSEV
ncbi:mismatch-specific DNA-glycosylase [bacterium]|nr:mismatch-specific DNA-glycosylase [bacterium]